MTCDAVGGVWQYANDLTAALAGEGVEVVLAMVGPAGSIPVGEGPGVIRTNLPLDWLASGPAEVTQAGRAIAALASEHGVDLVHLNSPALAAAASFPVPVVAAAHGCIGTWFAGLGEEPGPDLAWHLDLTGRGLRAADVVVAPSAAFAATVRQRYRLPVAPLVIHNGRANLPLPPSQPADQVLTAGRLWDRAKNVALLDEAAAMMSVPLRAAGPVAGPHGETIAPRNLHLLGSLSADALAAEYAAQPIFVSAARFEPFGLAVLEAAQAGCPLVLSAIDTFRELWTGAALLVGEDDPAAYAAAVERIRTEPGLRHHLSEAARLRASRYTPEAMAGAMLAIYRGLVDAPQRVAA